MIGNTTLMTTKKGWKIGNRAMKLTFRGGKTFKLLVVDMTAKTYTHKNGIASGSITLETAKELQHLEITLIQAGYKEV